jgi:outer membrane protein assembly factor BamB
MPGGKVIAVSMDTGAVGWESAISIPKGPTELDRVADVTGSPIVGERDLCAGSFQGRVTCLDAASGSQIWSREASAALGIGGDTGRIYVADEKGVVNAYERSGGALAWKNDQFLGRRLVGSSAASGYVTIGDFQGYIQWLDRADGKLVARGETDGVALAMAPIFVGSGVLVQTRKGGLYVFPNP